MHSDISASKPALSPADYLALKRRLALPWRRRADVNSLVHGSLSVPVDSDWPAPTDFGSLESLLRRMPAPQRAVCVLEALQILLAHLHWGPGFPEELDPAPVIECMAAFENWLAGESLQLEFMTNRQPTVGVGGPNWGINKGFWVSWMNAALAFSPKGGVKPGNAAVAIDCAMRYTSTVTQRPETTLWAGWWARCHARLAFADAMNADLIRE